MICCYLYCKEAGGHACRWPQFYHCGFLFRLSRRCTRLHAHMHALVDQIKRRSVALISPCQEIKGSLELQVWLQEAVSTSSCACYSHADLKEANL